MEYTDVTFYSQDARICGSLALPQPAEPRAAPGVLVLHGYTGARSEGFGDLAEVLAGAGMVALCIDQRGSGESGGARGHIYPLSHWLEDAHTGLSYLENHPQVEPQRLSVVGLSMGGGMAVCLAAIDPRVRCAVAMAPVGDGMDFLHSNWSRRGEAAWGEFLDRVRSAAHQRLTYGVDHFLPLWEAMPMPSQQFEQDYRRDRQVNPLLTGEVSLASIESVLRFSPEKLCPEVHTPILFMHDPADEIVPISHSQRMHDLVRGEKHLQEMPGGGHNLVVEARKEEVYAIVRDWLRVHLIERELA